MVEDLIKINIEKKIEDIKYDYNNLSNQTSYYKIYFLANLISLTYLGIRATLPFVFPEEILGNYPPLSSFDNESMNFVEVIDCVSTSVAYTYGLAGSLAYSVCKLSLSFKKNKLNKAKKELLRFKT